jgi:hypothetical protein
MSSTKKSEDKNETQETFFRYYGQLVHQQNMLQDYVRTSAYRDAIMKNRQNFQGKVVMDVVRFRFSDLRFRPNYNIKKQNDRVRDRVFLHFLQLKLVQNVCTQWKPVRCRNMQRRWSKRTVSAT